jgi:2-polyprenyl-6-methoxyphenol hydroxylase-like FAD-dependent oxidoreductase
MTDISTGSPSSSESAMTPMDDQRLRSGDAVATSKKAVDLLIIGGGIAGSSLGRSMAMAGAQVLIIEKDIKFRDRIRGELLVPWGSVEAKDLGGCGREAPKQYFYLAGEPTPSRDYLTSTPKGTCVMSFYHPEMQEVLLGSAAKAGAEVWRGAAMAAVYPGKRPEADIIVDGNTQRVSARLIVGADGRESQLATLLNFDRERDPPELFTGGLQLAGDLPTDAALYYFLHGISGRGSILIQNKPGTYRIYLMHHKDALPRRLSGERDYKAVLEHFREIGIPADWLDSVTPHGVFATFDGAHRWITQPIRGNCVLIGDAASASDPVWGCGLSRTLRDVRLLRDRLLGDPNWGAAAEAYAADHDDFFQRLRRVERLNAALHFSMGDAAEARRGRSYALLEKHPELNPDVDGLGPEAPCSDQIVNTLLELNH